MDKAAIIRTINKDELSKLLNLYKHLHKDDPELNVDGLASLWERIYHDPNMHYIVADNGKQYRRDQLVIEFECP